MNYYVISRIAKEYHQKQYDLVDLIEGDPFIPHLHNPYDMSHDKLSLDVFCKDRTAMENSDCGVVSLPIGEDCSSEVGWYAGNKKPVYVIIQSIHEYVNLKPIWMVKGFLTTCFVINNCELYTFIRGSDPILRHKTKYVKLHSKEKLNLEKEKG